MGNLTATCIVKAELKRAQDVKQDVKNVSQAAKAAAWVHVSSCAKPHVKKVARLAAKKAVRVHVKKAVKVHAKKAVKVHAKKAVKIAKVDVK